MGATATGDMDALPGPATFEELAANSSSGQQFEAEPAYGFPAYNDRLTLTPALALALFTPIRTTASSDPWHPIPIRLRTPGSLGNSPWKRSAKNPPPLHHQWSIASSCASLTSILDKIKRRL